MGKTNKLWGSRFKKPLDKLAEGYLSSFRIDNRLASYDIDGSVAHAEMLGRTGIISRTESKRLISGLTRVKRKLDQTNTPQNLNVEDVHSWVQMLLKKEVGRVADKLHTARSRNDQIVLDERLYMRDMIKEIAREIHICQAAILSLAEKEKATWVPAYTHLRRAQCVSVAHHLLAYVEMLERDSERLADAYKRVDTLPLGACALSGTTLPIDRLRVAKKLGFSRIASNSMDAVSDRDFIIETLAHLSILSMHLSRIADDLILWSSPEFGLVKIDESLMTGSSIMPHKQNPDPLELIRGATGKTYGNLLSLLVVMKGLPLTYHRDLQHDKEPLFDSHLETLISLMVMTKIFKTLRIDRGRAAMMTQDEDLFSVDIVDDLIRGGMSYRQAHDVTGKLLRHCHDQKRLVKDLSAVELKRIHPMLTPRIKKLLNAETSVLKKESFGGTGPRSVARQLVFWRRRVKVRR
jgi:argininosuccinate lyase